MRRNMKHRFLAVCLLIPLMTISMGFPGFSGCSGSTTHKLTAAEHDFKSVVQAFQDAEIAEYQVGGVEPALHQAIQNKIIALSVAGKELAVMIQTNASPVTIQTEVNAIYSIIDDLLDNGVLRVVNPKSRANLEIALNGIKAVINPILVLVANGGK